MLYILCFSSIYSYAETLAGNTNLKITVNVLESTCILNDNKSINMIFDNIESNLINGRRYSQNIVYKFDCPNRSANMKIQVAGTSYSSGSPFLDTTLSNLGMYFTINDKTMAVNQWYDFIYPNLPIINVAPIQAGPTIVPTGHFTATGILVVYYE